MNAFQLADEHNERRSVSRPRSRTIGAGQLFGGYGYTTDLPAERFMRDAKITQIYQGTNQIRRLVMSRALLR